VLSTAYLAATPLDNELAPLAENNIASPAALQLDEETAQSVADPTENRAPYTTIEDKIDGLANKLAALCFKCFEQGLNLGDGGNIVDMNFDQGAFDEELRV